MSVIHFCCSLVMLDLVFERPQKHGSSLACLWDSNESMK